MLRAPTPVLALSLASITLSAAALLIACGDDDRPARDAGPGPGRDAGPDAGGGSLDGGPDAGGTICPRAPAPADGTRRVVVSHPYSDSGAQDDRYEVLELTPDGDLTTGGPAFRMGRSTGGEIVFTPDGEVGLVAQEDGTLGVFRLGADGAPEVLHAAYDGAFYAGAVVMDPAGSHAWVLDSEWRESGGGVYRVEIGCEGTIEGEWLVAPAKLPYALVPRGDGTALLAAKDVLDSPAGADAHLLRLEDPPAVVASANAFPDEDFIVAGSALTANGRHFLMGDNAAFSGLPNRVAVVSVDGDWLSSVQVLSPLEDPVSIATSPFDDVALVVSGFGDAVFVLDYTPADAEPFRIRREGLTYEGARPQLPGAAVVLRRGRLEGLTLVAENVGVRRIRFRGAGEVTDLGATILGSGTEWVVGALGVTP